VAAKRSGRLGEFELIEEFFRPLATDPGAFALTDDAAVCRSRPGEDLVITCDMILEGVHFLSGDRDSRAIAQKALRVNLSDLAAKGAEPFGYLLSLALPGDWRKPWVRGFARGLGEDQERYGVTLLGGDLSRALGGVTGTIGDAALGLAWWQQRIPRIRGGKQLFGRYGRPEPRVAIAPVLRRYATSAIDVSDGLVGDLAHICDVSRVGAVIDVDAVPLSNPAKQVLAVDRTALSLVLAGGDDYEILATVPRSSADDFVSAAAAVGVTVTRIGRIVAGKGPPVVRDADGDEIAVLDSGYTHF